jgi:hypothetical protein
MSQPHYELFSEFFIGHDSVDSVIKQLKNEMFADDLIGGIHTIQVGICTTFSVLKV